MSLLSKGDRGSAVTDLQEQLNELGYELDVDGAYGRETTAAVRHFQSSWSLDVDGIVGPATHAKIKHSVNAGWEISGWDVDEWADD